MVLKNVLYFSLEVWGCIFCVLSSVCVYISRNTNIRVNKNLLYILITNAIVLFFDSLAWFFRGKEGDFEYYILVISNFMVFFLNYILLFEFTLLIKNSIEKNRKVKTKLFYIVYVVCTIGALLTIISQFTNFYYYFDVHNFYHRNKWFPISQIWGVIGILFDIIIVLKYRKFISKNDMIMFMIYMFMPAITLVIQTFIYGFSLLNITTTVAILMMFLISQIEQATLIVQQERLINEANVNITLSQIQPHFLYNCLNTIRYLCKHDAKEAESAVTEFSDYLRGNMFGITAKNCIPFERELEHINSYIALEKKRFGSRLSVEYNIKETGFMLPALSLQPIVENSIKYGLMNRIEGIVVKISSDSDDKNYILTVEDNGMGFDYEKVCNDEKPHIGIKNVRTKLELMCNGRLIIDSKIGVGTSVKILLPKKI